MIKEELIRLENNLIKSKNPILDRLGGSGMTESQEKNINKKLKFFGLKASSDFLDFYNWREGIEIQTYLSDPIFKLNIEIFNFGNYYTFDLNSYFFILDKNVARIYKGRFFPLFHFNGFGVAIEDCILIDLLAESPTYGQLYIFSPGVTLEGPETIYDSLETCIKTINACYESNIYTVDSNTHEFKMIGTDKEISKELNPNSEFWKY